MKARIYISKEDPNKIIRKYINPFKKEIINEEKKFLERDSKNNHLNIINNNKKDDVDDSKIINTKAKIKKIKEAKTNEEKLLNLIGKKLGKIKKKNKK